MACGKMPPWWRGWLFCLASVVTGAGEWIDAIRLAGRDAATSATAGARSGGAKSSVATAAEAADGIAGKSCVESLRGELPAVVVCIVEPDDVM